MEAESAVKTRPDFSAVEGAILGSLGLLLGFTMSMAVTRFEVWKQLVLDEANAIGTCYLCAQLLPAPESVDIRSLLRQYVEVRLQYGIDGENADQIKTTREQTARLEDEIWTRAATYAQEDSNPVKTGLLLQSLNQVIDLEASRWMALQNHVPITVIAVNCVLGLLTAIFMGYPLGLGGRRQLFATFVLALGITAALAVTIDLDRPHRGLIRAGQQPLINLQSQTADI
jgi:hypothetical protein